MTQANPWTYLKVNRWLLASLDAQFEEIQNESARLDASCGGIDPKKKDGDSCSPAKLFNATRKFNCLPSLQKLDACKEDDEECKSKATEELVVCEAASLQRLRDPDTVDEFLSARLRARGGCELEEKRFESCKALQGGPQERDCTHEADKVWTCKAKPFDPAPWRDWNDCCLRVGRDRCRLQEAILRNVPVRREFSLYAKYFDVPIDHVRIAVIKEATAEKLQASKDS